jgi:hypothetical protein
MIKTPMPDLEPQKPGPTSNNDKGILARAQSQKLMEVLTGTHLLLTQPNRLEFATQEQRANICYDKGVQNPHPLLTVEAVGKTRKLLDDSAATPDIKNEAIKVLRAHEKNLVIVIDNLEATINRSLAYLRPQTPPQHSSLTRILEFKIAPGKQTETEGPTAILFGIHPDIEEVLKKYPGRELMLEKSQNARREGERHLKDYNERLRTYTPEQAANLVNLANIIAFQTPGTDKEGDPNHLRITSEGQSTHLFQPSLPGQIPKLSETGQEFLKKMASREENPDLVKQMIRRILATNTNL